MVKVLTAFKPPVFDLATSRCQAA